MIFQQFGLLPWRTVRENVGLGLELRGEPAAERRRIVDEKLELVGLSQWADHYGHELSGGMQQRVGLARAFATDAEILLMDEPFSALDPLIRSKLQDELRSLQQRVRKSILFVTHDLDEALRLGDRISVLEAGRIMQSGTPADIMLRPANAHVAEFVRHVNPLSVLNGSVVMRPWRDLELRDGRRWLDPARQYELLCDEQDRPIAAQFDGRTLNLCGPDGPTRQGLDGRRCACALARADRMAAGDRPSGAADRCRRHLRGVRAERGDPRAGDQQVRAGQCRARVSGAQKT